MAEPALSSSRILVDLQACQTEGSSRRGVGRYSFELFSAMADLCGSRDLRALLSENLPHDVDLDGIPESRVLRLPALPDWTRRPAHEGGERDALDTLALASFVAPWKPDIVHVSHVFEGFGDRAVLPGPCGRVAGQLLSATLYDLIPLLFADFYLANAQYRRWYDSRLAWLRQADLLLAISGHSRQDAIDHLGIAPERIVTIYGGVSGQFRPVTDPVGARADLRRRYGLRDRFVMYAGGDDHRKNISGAIAGFAAVPAEHRRNCQLAIVCAIQESRRTMFLKEAAAQGLAEGDVVLTGYVPESDLLAFYSCCDLFVFPSLYEGFGLPVLEAMACGAPVIGGNNSSVRELVGRPDALFDASAAESIGEAITRVLTDRAFAGDLRAYGSGRAREFTWENSARLALDAFDEAHARHCAAGVSSAISGWVPRKRIAMFTPLPPCRSGIADYNARFLPYLARHFDIDLYVDGYEVSDPALNASFRIFRAEDFGPVAAEYDAILYEFGNSEFHAHMLPMLEAHPGIVGLHDAYLSGLYGYVEFNMGRRDAYVGEMLNSHGPRARAIFAPIQANPEPNGTAMVALPCTKRVMDGALGLISHSPFNLELARQHYPEGWQAPYRIIPQMVPVPQPLTAVARTALRAELGFREDDIVITTFGHVTWTKWGDRLLDAFVGSIMTRHPRTHLVYAGALAEDAFGKKLGERLASRDVAGRVRVTGFLPESDYESYLRITDIAVQLRTSSRGGTPKGVLDCLARGLPVVVNNAASYTDYPDEVVVKIAADPDPADIAGAVIDLATSDARRAACAASGLAYVREHHDPAHCAAQYAAAVHEFVQRHELTGHSRLPRKFAPHLAGCENVEMASWVAAEWLKSIPQPGFSRRRLLFDVSHIAGTDHGTGIQRVVREIARALYCSERTGFEPVAVELVDGGLQPALSWLKSRGLLCPADAASMTGPIVFRPGDVLLMLDSSWARYREFHPVFDAARRSRVPVVTTIYDILPILLPPGNFVEGGKEWFEGWFRDALASSDKLVCISRAVADDVAAYAREHCTGERVPEITHWHLGSDFSRNAPAGAPGSGTAPLGQRRYLLMVGTIEPRKRHELALDAMELMWRDGSDLCLCIAGKEGWMVDDLMRRLRSHPLAGQRLFLMEATSDADISFLYAHAAGLLFLSRGEGFGLPLIEAANHGLPIVCSDLPVFREIAGSFATYVTTQDAAGVAREINDWLLRERAGQVPLTHDMPRLTWAQSAERLLDVLGFQPASKTAFSPTAGHASGPAFSLQGPR